MIKFNKSNLEYFKKCIYYSEIHDSKMETFSYNSAKKELLIEVVTLAKNVKIALVFKKIKKVIFLSDVHLGDSETILGFSVVDEGFDLLKDDIENDFLCINIEMFSGDKFCVISKEVWINFS